MPGPSSYINIYTGFAFYSENGSEGPSGPPGNSGVGISNIINGSGSNIVITLTNSQQYTIAIPTVTGLTGATGPKGDIGNTGASGTNGINGTNGTNGTNGAAGTNGTNGINGTNGSSFLQGAGVPSGGLGTNFDSYLNITTFDLYKKLSGSWGSPVGNLKGAGVPVGGTVGQYLVKVDSTDYNTTWTTPTGVNKVSNVDISGQTTSQTVATYSMPATSNAILRINTYINVNVYSSGNVLVQVAYTDMNSNVITTQIGGTLSSVGNTGGSLVIKVLENTIVTISTVVTGSLIYSVGEVIEYLY